MKTLRINTVLVFAVLLLVMPSAWGADRVFVRDGYGKTRSGQITAVNRAGVQVTSGSRSETVPAEAIAYTVFDDDPPRLINVRTALIAGRFREAREEFSKITMPNNVTPLAAQDHQFLDLATRGRLVLETTTPDSATLSPIAEAAVAFVVKYPDSYHYDEVCQLASELMASLGDSESRVRMLEVLATSPQCLLRWDAVTTLGEIELAAGDTAAARVRWQQLRSDAELSTSYRRRAEIGDAECLAADGEIDAARDTLEKLLAMASRESATDTVGFATLWNALGGVLEQGERPSEAVLAYLHVELLYPSARSQWRHALQRLEKLWRQLGREDRATAAAQKLNSP